jgi:hypothetical protein
MLVILGIWRASHPPLSVSLRPLLGCRLPARVCTVSTYRLGRVVVLLLLAMPRLFIWVALLAWTAALVGLIRDLFARHV